MGRVPIIVAENNTLRLDVYVDGRKQKSYLRIIVYHLGTYPKQVLDKIFWKALHILIIQVTQLGKNLQRNHSDKAKCTL